MNSKTMTFAMVIALAAVFTIASPLDVATAQTSDAMPDGSENGGSECEGGEGGEHKEGKSCPSKERKSQQSQEQSS